VIDQFNEQPWPEEVIAAVAQFKQGHLVERPPFFYAAAPRYSVWGLTKAVGDEHAATELLEVDPDDGPPYGLITSQTCDLNEQSLRPKQPWLKIAPVYAMDGVLSQDQQNQVLNDEIGHLIALTGTNLPQGFWIVDLRIEVPVEKSWLVGREPIEAFASEHDYLRLARRLARRHDRPALANAVSLRVVLQLRNGLKKLKRPRRTALLKQVQELRLAIEGTRLEPASARLIVITHNTSSEAVREWFDEWWDSAHTLCEADNLNLLGNRYTTLAELSAADYQAAIPLDFDHLSPDD
jgi:hypothetical protein